MVADNKNDEQYSDFTNVETQRNFLAPEDYPEGPYGAPRGKDDPVENKETPWEEGQQFYSNFNYEFRSLHQNLPRQFPGAHPTHDEKGKERQPPYDDSPM